MTTSTHSPALIDHYSSSMITIRQRNYLMYFFFNDTPTTEIYTLSLHDALPICVRRERVAAGWIDRQGSDEGLIKEVFRSEEHTSELQSHSDLVCRLLLEKKKKKRKEKTTAKDRTA